MGKALSSTEASLGAHSQDGPSLSTVPVSGGMMGPWEQEEQATRAPEAGAKRSMLQIHSETWDFLRERQEAAAKAP